MEFKLFDRVVMAILGALDVVFYIISPALLLFLLTNFSVELGLGRTEIIILYFVGLGSMAFRAIKIGWLKGND